MEAGNQYCAAPGADMDRRVVIDIFFTAPDGWVAEISDLHGSQRNIVRHHYLWEYPVLISGILSKETVRSLRYLSNGLFDFNRNAKGIRWHYPLQVFSADKNRPGRFAYLLSYVPGGILIYVLSLVFRIAIAYFTLKQQTEEILLQKSHAELNLLKSQVQPHFLFNALNSIYYRVYKIDPPSAGLIERLSDIMRYFVDESPKEAVPVADRSCIYRKLYSA